ncbi:hypothetical protein SAMN02745216_02479 [Desulfatibacillum alkenivorans DSM 16219]|uniref:Uncharacterized protein n=1 Tax=Desulfatibacillum alkenivorans DSM 16219 TaxID=1121393 RepID=A0A1M6N1I7_9BACT|nr:DUF444 family protein [Desulfatibacillum alkenivorans]SHJ89569.1 hypothetical protein SAMN02745216_02479 [Desulfatibacillum alkenivorans DSM 16219]
MAKDPDNKKLSLGSDMAAPPGGPSKGPGPGVTYVHTLSSVDELLERDAQREKDGFPRKIRIGRFMKPARGGKDKVILVPTTVEEKFMHDTRPQDEQEEQSTGGSGEGQEGEVIGEQPVHQTSGSGQGASGEGDSGGHEIESSAYDLGRILTEKFQLPNLKDKGKKRSLTKYTYDLTDRHVGSGQVLDKKATFRQIVKTNIALGRIDADGDIDASELIMGPKDRVFRIVSREKDFESQAMVFFVRDYSGSMSGKPTEAVVSQHVLIYSWLLYQYDRQVETRFILHDTEAKEVDDFHTYYSSTVAGGTRVKSAYQLVNEIVEKESLERDYNIYVFHGTDGDDWDSDGRETLPELKKMLLYSSRVGVSIAERYSGGQSKTVVERYIRNSGLLHDQNARLSLDSFSENADEDRLIEGIRRLMA